MKTTEKHLYYLSELSDYTVETDYPDVRNWPVKDSVFRTIGTVRDLVVNKSTEKVVYLDVEVDRSVINDQNYRHGRPADTDVHNFINEEGEDHVIVPIGLVDINRTEEYVFTENIDHKTFSETKRKRGDAPVDREYETAVLSSYGRRYAPGSLDKRADSDIEDTKIDRTGSKPDHGPMIGERMDSDIKDTEERRDDRTETIKERHNPGKYGNEKTTSETTDKETDRSGAGSEDSKDPDEFRDDFYAGREFDDTKFHRGKE